MPLDVVFLDWGNTLMVDDGSQCGPMATWPQVSALAGAQEALRRLRPRYRLIVATNAEESPSSYVVAALARVGLADLVDGVVSSRDVGHAKPDTAFYREALAAAGSDARAADRAVMVGDSWDDDVAGALAAGLHAVWLNTSGLPIPAVSQAADAVITSISELPAALAAIDRA